MDGVAGGAGDRGDDAGSAGLWRLRHDHPWLVAAFPGPRRVLSWSLTRPGFVAADRIAWREVRDADLPPDLDARLWLEGELAAAGLADAVAMMTSRPLIHRRTAVAEAEGARAACLATVGLSNAERAGERRGAAARAGTINLLVALDRPLTDAALLEALALAASARALAVREAEGRASGTGTDCIAVAAPPGPDPAPYAGMHTALGEAVGRAVFAAVDAGARAWLAERAAGRLGA
jgi:adenosylcobinamide amidohydrolase